MTPTGVSREYVGNGNSGAEHPFVGAFAVEVWLKPFDGPRNVGGGGRAVPYERLVGTVQVSDLHRISSLRIVSFGGVGQPQAVPFVDLVLFVSVVHAEGVVGNGAQINGLDRIECGSAFKMVRIVEVVGSERSRRKQWHCLVEEALVRGSERHVRPIVYAAGVDETVGGHVGDGRQEVVHETGL